MARKYSSKKRTTKPRTRIKSSQSGGKRRQSKTRPKAKPKVFSAKQMRAYIAAVKASRGEEE